MSRYFNEITDRGDFLLKRSLNKVKLKEEFNYLNSVPENIRQYYPAVKDFKEEKLTSSYLIQKIPVADMSFEIIKPQVNEDLILVLLEKLNQYLSLVPAKKVSPTEWMEVIQREILDKNLDRLQQLEKLDIASELNFIAANFGFKSIRDYFEKLNATILQRLSQEAQERLCFSHGDLCFSNMLLQDEQLYLIDPKGAQNSTLNYRPAHYELAKISQSLIGQYDHINHGLYQIQDRVKINFNHFSQLANARKKFAAMIESQNSSLRNVRLIEASLFASLIPFHQESDLKMRAFLINSISIFKEVL